MKVCEVVTALVRGNVHECKVLEDRGAGRFLVVPIDEEVTRNHGRILITKDDLATKKKATKKKAK